MLLSLAARAIASEPGRVVEIACAYLDGLNDHGVHGTLNDQDNHLASSDSTGGLERVLQEHQVTQQRDAGAAQRVLAHYAAAVGFAERMRLDHVGAGEGHREACAAAPGCAHVHVAAEPRHLVAGAAHQADDVDLGPELLHQLVAAGLVAEIDRSAAPVRPDALGGTPRYLRSIAENRRRRRPRAHALAWPDWPPASRILLRPAPADTW